MRDWLCRYRECLAAAGCPPMGAGAKRWCEHMADELEGLRWRPQRAATAVTRWLKVGSACGLRWRGQSATPKPKFAPPPLRGGKRHIETRRELLVFAEDLDARCLYWLDYVARDLLRNDKNRLTATFNLKRWASLLRQCGGEF